MDKFHNIQKRTHRKKTKLSLEMKLSFGEILMIIVMIFWS
jgi:uncharacterized protein (UPF0333 family)